MDNKLPTKTITMENIEEIYEYIFAPYVKQLNLSFLKIEEGRVIAKLKILLIISLLLGLFLARF